MPFRCSSFSGIAYLGDVEALRPALQAFKGARIVVAEQGL